VLTSDNHDHASFVSTTDVAGPLASIYMKVLLEGQPLESKKIVKNLMIYFGVIGLFTTLSGGLLIGGGITLFLLVLVFLDEELNATFSGWFVENEHITLYSKTFFLGRVASQKILISKISRILYIESAPRRPRTILFTTPLGTFTLRPAYDIFELAGFLKYFYERGIEIKSKEKDHEIQLFITGKIDSLPMTNEMKIKN